MVDSLEKFIGIVGHIFCFILLIFAACGAVASVLMMIMSIAFVPFGIIQFGQGVEMFFFGFVAFVISCAVGVPCAKVVL